MRASTSDRRWFWSICGVFEETREAQTAYAFPARNVGRPYARYRILEVSRDHLEKAPGFDADHWPMMNDEKWQRELHTYYGRLPYWE